MRHLLVLLGITGSMCAMTGPSYAQAPSDPLFSLKRLSVGAGIERENLLAYASEEQA